MLAATANLRHGGGKGAAELAARVLANRPDVLALTEYRRAKGAELRRELVRSGYTVLDDAATESTNSICLATRHSVERRPAADPELESNHWIEAFIPTLDLHVGAVYLPTRDRVGLEGKRRFWHAIHRAASCLHDRRTLLLGDWNTGGSQDTAGKRPFSCLTEYDRMADLGYVEAWRTHHGARVEYSWYSIRKSGRRLDHAFISPALGKHLRNAWYDHGIREARLCDHSPLFVEFAQVTA